MIYGVNVSTMTGFLIRWSDLNYNCSRITADGTFRSPEAILAQHYRVDNYISVNTYTSNWHHGLIDFIEFNSIELYYDNKFKVTYAYNTIQVPGTEYYIDTDFYSSNGIPIRGFCEFCYLQLVNDIEFYDVVYI